MCVSVGILDKVCPCLKNAVCVFFFFLCVCLFHCMLSHLRRYTSVS